MVRKAVVLAAGKSTRIAAVGGGLPKPLLEVGRKPVLARNLRWLADAGIREAWVNLHYRPEAIVHRIRDGRGLGLQVRYKREPTILGTAGGVRAIASGWTETFVVLYGDNLVRTSLERMWQEHQAAAAPITIGLFDQKRHAHSGIAGGTVTVDASGRVTAFNEGVGGQSSSLVNAGLYLLEPEVVARIPAATSHDFGRDLFPRLLASGVPINGHVIDGYCLGLDTPEAYWRALRLIEQGMVQLK